MSQSRELVQIRLVWLRQPAQVCFLLFLVLCSRPAITHFSVSDLGSSNGPIDAVSMDICATDVFCVAEPHCKPGLVQFTKDSHGNPLYYCQTGSKNSELLISCTLSKCNPYLCKDTNVS